MTTRRYAEGSSVPVERSRAEVERTLERYGASGFGYSWERKPVRQCRYDDCRKKQPTEACEKAHRWEVKTVERETVHVTFKLKERVVRLDVPFPTTLEAGGDARLAAGTRQRWRALVLVLKAKLEAVESGISTLESEFLANMVMRNGMTIGQAMVSRLPEVVESGRLLPAPGETHDG